MKLTDFQGPWFLVRIKKLTSSCASDIFSIFFTLKFFFKYLWYLDQYSLNEHRINFYRRPIWAWIGLLIHYFLISLLKCFSKQEKQKIIK